MGGQVCQHIIQANLRVVFTKPEIQTALDDYPRKKAKVNAILAKDYSLWADADVRFLIRMESEVYFEAYEDD